MTQETTSPQAVASGSLYPVLLQEEGQYPERTIYTSRIFLQRQRQKETMITYVSYRKEQYTLPEYSCNVEYEQGYNQFFDEVHFSSVV